MIRSRAARLAIFVLPAFAAAQEPDPPPRRTLAAESAALLERASGRHPFDDLRAWARDDGAEAAWLDSGDPEIAAARDEALVCGLWADDPDVRFAAACHVPRDRLDLRDIDRWLEAIWPHAFDEHGRYDWDTFKRVVDFQWVDRVLEPRPLWRADVRGHFLGDLHRSLRPRNIPALCRLVAHDDPLVRKQAFGLLELLSRYTDRYREDIANEILRWPGAHAFVLVDDDDPAANPRYAPRAFEPPASLLAACLERCLLGPEKSEQPTEFDGFLLRWADDAAPGELGAELLVALLDSPRPRGRWIALRGLRARRDDQAVRHALASFMERAEDDERLLALAAAGQRRQLLALAATDARALAIALETDRDAAWTAWRRRALGPEPAAGLVAIERLAEARELTTWGPYRLPESLDEDLRAAIDAGAFELDLDRLVALGREFPAARTTAQAGRILALLDGARLEGFPLAPLLELHDEPGLRARLAAWASDAESPGRAAALELLLRLGVAAGAAGAEELGAALADRYLRAGDEGDRDPLLLARSGGTAPVRELLVQEARAAAPAGGGAALAAVAAARGVTEPAARGWAWWLEHADPDVRSAHWPEWRAAVVERDPIAAILASLAAAPPPRQWFTDLGTIDDERVLAHLRALRATPGVPVQDVIGELAVAGDAGARRELERVRDGRIYGWMDDASTLARAEGRALRLLPFWIGEIETNCCRRNVAGMPLRSLAGYDVHQPSEEGLLTQHDHAARWWRAVEGHLRWSRIADRFEVAPR